MDVLPIFITFNVAEQILPYVIMGSAAVLVDQIHFQRMKERVQWGVDIPMIIAAVLYVDGYSHPQSQLQGIVPAAFELPRSECWMKPGSGRRCWAAVIEV